ncbi:alpha/beta hydrolase [Henriciella sp. AS95]|uniref:alpha/beta fold hydrolase n=1 Tax=Henriciella sp. AS95 TaxID=3135782 RepID=UPI00316CE1EF
MPRIAANGIEIEYEEYGNPSDPMLLVVSGFSGQMITWPESFKQGLAEAGRRVVIFDNRDIGLTTEFADKIPPSPRDIMKGIAAGEPMHEQVPYTLDDMAADAAALIQALGAEKADVMGFSMGGMIVQLLALNHPDRVRTLIPVMTTSGDPTLPSSTEEAQKALTAVPETRDAETIGTLAAQSRRVIGSHETVRNSDEQTKAMAMRAFERSDRPMGVARQYAAILAQPRWHHRLPGLDVPTLVLHGAQDPLIRPAAGQDIADRIPGAEIEIIDKWGHDLPDKMVPVLLNRIVPFLGRHVPEEARADA